MTGRKCTSSHQGWHFDDKKAIFVELFKYENIFRFVFYYSVSVSCATPQVPHKMQFAGMTLTIRDDARREIQKDVNALTQSARHHNIKVERAKTYFPIIEKVFEEERVPDDFKYLVIQESALIADAVSVSNAVGFWQFKDFTALEMGLRVDKEIDERLNIVSSSRAAARISKRITSISITGSLPYRHIRWVQVA